MLTFYNLVMFDLKDGWRIAGATDMARMPSISIKVEVYLCVHLLVFMCLL